MTCACHTTVNICRQLPTLYGVHCSEGHDALVTQLVEGDVCEHLLEAVRGASARAAAGATAAWGGATAAAGAAAGSAVEAKGGGLEGAEACLAAALAALRQLAHRGGVGDTAQVVWIVDVEGKEWGILLLLCGCAL